MNAPVIHRPILKQHVEDVERLFPIRILGQLPRGSAGHIDENDANALEFLAESRPGLTLIDHAGAEVELGDRLGRRVGIVLLGGLKGREAEEFPKLARPL